MGKAGVAGKFEGVDACGVGMGVGGVGVAVLSKCERVSHRALAVGRCFGSFAQHFSATSQITSDS